MRIGDSFSSGAIVQEGPPPWISTAVSVLVGLSLFAAMAMLVGSQRQAAFLAPEDDPDVRRLVAQSGSDSLAYFATRRDKSVVFAPHRKAAVTHRVELGGCLASSDPIGPVDHWPAAIAAWQELVTGYGWTPAVIGASEAGARAYDRAGLRVIRLGDEAVLRPDSFTLEGREMRPVRQPVQRLQKLGYTVRLRRDLDPTELADLVAETDSWRDTETERGFSMAVGRLGDPADGDCLLVEALFSPGSSQESGPGSGTAGVLSFVPWRVVTANDAISAAVGDTVTADTDLAALRRFCDRQQTAYDQRWTRGAVLLELYEHLVEHSTVAPTFYTDFPAEVSPLTRPHRDDLRLAER